MTDSLSVPIDTVGAMQFMERVRLWFEPSSAQAQAEDVFRSLWKRTARADSTRHPFHREVLTDLDVLLDTVAAAAPDTLVRVKNLPTPWDVVPHLYPHISRRLTPEWIRSFVVAEVARVAAVADSTDYLTARSQELWSGGIRHTVTVQHRLSGLRATMFFIWQLDEMQSTAKSI